MYKGIGITLLLGIITLTLLLSPLQARPANTTSYRDQVAVLMYHHIHDKDESSSTITSALFRSQLRMLKDNGYRFLTLAEFESFMQGAPVPDNAVLVTFDDGYQSFYTAAYPILRELGVPAVNFVITMNLANPLGSYIPSLSGDEIREMTQAGVGIDVGCHTDALHYKLPSGKAALVGRLSAGETDDAYKQRVAGDATACRQKLAALTTQPLDAYAYPYGIASPLAAQLVQNAGFRYAFTITPEMATRRADPLHIPRINAGSPNISPEELHRSIQRRIELLPGGVDAERSAR
ncbi:polysaccharide deacetylase family protein [Paenibacillus athensensis]|uniref:NodB homology domain-containing protein n=1 Tax=Paenibacillus athensensis TaxID=1967502 RepID=A0A4Y8QB39_9BACL|nr:polysaccharide deacetylase family protein [Paenibacillus athensensis]MCD1258916.1 polysaccharide deacetylase family protein [Paenibacillus athensensis]